MPLSRLAQLAAGGVLLLGSALAQLDGTPQPFSAPAPVQQARYMPLTPARSLKYRDPEGHTFTLTFGAPIAVKWFDATLRRVVPVRDSRCTCVVLMHDFQDGEVRAIGTITDGPMQQWGEPIVVFPGDGQGATEAVQTPAGYFERALRVETDAGTAWFAPGVGLIKVNDYSLVNPAPVI
jgi:hypothetical protein